jgi:hypothetical protein
VSGLTPGQIESRGLRVATVNPESGETELADVKTGAVRTVPTVSPDVGFATNPGKDWWQQTDKIIRERLTSYPPELAKVVKAELQELMDKKRP